MVGFMRHVCLPHSWADHAHASDVQVVAVGRDKLVLGLEAVRGVSGVIGDFVALVIAGACRCGGLRQICLLQIEAHLSVLLPIVRSPPFIFGDGARWQGLLDFQEDGVMVTAEQRRSIRARLCFGHEGRGEPW